MGLESNSTSFVSTVDFVYLYTLDHRWLVLRILVGTIPKFGSCPDP
jgi:hypothetical protein